MAETPAQPVTPDPVTPPPSASDAPVADPAAAVDAMEERVLGQDDPLEEPAPELGGDQPAVEPPA